MAVKGTKQTPEHIAKRVEAWKRSTALVKARERFIALNKSRTGQPLSDEQKRKKSVSMKGKQCALGTKRSLEFRKYLSEYWTDNPDHNLRIDGKGHERRGLRKTESSRLAFRLWRESVFERDQHTCVSCGQRGGILAPHHKKPYSLFPELKFDVDNGETLCKRCHEKTETFGFKFAAIIRNNGGYTNTRKLLEAGA